MTMDDFNTENHLMEPIFKDGVYENPFNTWKGLPGRATFWDFMKERWTQAAAYAIPKKEVLDKTLPIVKPDLSQLENPPSERIQYTWIGHATVLYQIAGWNLLSDPIWSERCSPVQFLGPKRYRPPPLTIGELPRIDAVVISHNHYDHLDKHSVAELNRRFGNKLQWVVPAGLGSWFRSMSCENVTELTWWQSKALEGDGLTKRKLDIVCTPAQHWSLRNGCDRNQSLWSSYVFLSDKHKIFFSGDTAYCEAFESIGREYGPFDLSAIAIGAYCPRNFMSNQHVDPQDALKIHADLRSKLSFGIHWGTFPMGSTEPYLEPRKLIDELQNAASEKTFITVQHGE